jgi:hypothetical protein
METDHELPEFGTGLRAHLELHGISPDTPRRAVETADLFALFAPAPPTPARRLRLRPAAFAGA